MRNRTIVTIAALALLAACSSSGSSGGTSAPATTASETTAVDTTGPGSTTPETTTPGTDTTSPATTAAPTTVPATTVPCPSAGTTHRKESDDPLGMSGMVGVDIRTGAHDCFERVVLEFAAGPGDFPGWWVEYVDDPVTLGESDDTVMIEGDATLLVRTGSWMPDMEGHGYDGETQLFPTNVAHILELRQIENWEGVSIWVVGLDAEYPFTVTTLTGPARLVIDVQTGR